MVSCSISLGKGKHGTSKNIDLFLRIHRLADVINDWRITLDLEPIPATEGPFLAETLKIPYSYCWSPGLVPKPEDWKENIGTNQRIRTI